MASERLGFLVTIAALVGIGLFFVLYLGIGGWRRLNEWEARALRATATVVRHEVRSTRANVYHYPVVRFLARTGTEVVVEAPRPSRRPDPPVGGELEVLYAPEQPSVVRLEGQDRAGAIFMGALGALFVAVGVVMAVVVFGAGAP